MQSRSKIMTVSLVALALSPATSQPAVADASRERGWALATVTPVSAASAHAGGLLSLAPRPYRKG